MPANYIELESYQSNYGDGMFDPVKPARVRMSLCIFNLTLTFMSFPLLLWLIDMTAFASQVRPVKHEAHMASRLFTPVTDEEFLEADQGTLHEVQSSRCERHWGSIRRLSK